jgi:hypothetical protein
MPTTSRYPISLSYSYFATASGVHVVIATLLAATPPTDLESGHLDPWEALELL